METPNSKFQLNVTDVLMMNQMHGCVGVTSNLHDHFTYVKNKISLIFTYFFSWCVQMGEGNLSGNGSWQIHPSRWTSLIADVGNQQQRMLYLHWDYSQPY